MNLERIEVEKEKVKKLVAKGFLTEPARLSWPEDAQAGLKSYIQSWYERIYHFDFLEEGAFEEQIFHSPGHIQINFGDKKLFDGIDLTQEDFQLALEIIGLKNSVTWNYSKPFASFELELKGRKFRASLLHHSLCKEHGSKMFLRSIAPKPFSINLFYESPFELISLARQKKNALVCGGTGSGKTSLLNSLLSFSENREHLVILEDTFELLSPHANVTRLVARDERPDDLKSFMSYAMRMNPERIILGELRSGEVEPYLLAMNSGHKGVLSSIHANSALDAIHRVALLARLYSANPLEYELVLKLVCQNIDAVVYMENKKVKEIIEVFGSEGSQIFYEKKAAQAAAV